MYSKMHSAWRVFPVPMRRWRTPVASMATIVPGSISR
jgi:hypothetical protein